MSELKIRLTTHHDLRLLEWGELHRRHRQIIEETFSRQEAGEVEMLVAELKNDLVGQVWIDYEKRKSDSAAVLWALRVHPDFQNQGIGTHLIEAAFDSCKKRGFKLAEIGVEKDNLGALALYERLGFVIVKENIEKWTFKTPEGKELTETADEFLLQREL